MHTVLERSDIKTFPDESTFCAALEMTFTIIQTASRKENLGSVLEAAKNYGDRVISSAWSTFGRVEECMFQ